MFHLSQTVISIIRGNLFFVVELNILQNDNIKKKHRNETEWRNGAQF